MKFHAEFADSPTLYTATFILAMNKAPIRYACRRSEDGASTGIPARRAAQAAGRMWDDQAAVVGDAARERGNTITQIDRAEAERWQSRRRSR